MTVFNSQNKIYSLTTKMFFDEGTSIQRYDKLKYPQFDILTERQLSFFWLPSEVNLTKDSKDFRDLTDHEKHIFTSNLKRQILLDSVQGRAPAECFLPVVSLPEIENWVITWTFSETIHSRSYTHIIRNVYSDPSIIFDGILDIQEIVDCAKDISKYYDTLSGWNLYRELDHEKYNEYEHKKALWLALNSVNALEGVRFYASFICSWNFAELKKMEGNAKIIKFICKDENLHLASTQKMIQLLPQDDPDFEKIRIECADEIQKMFVDVVEQEKAWADYLFKDGSMIGLNADILKSFVCHIANKRMKAIGIESPYSEYRKNPLPWADKWIAGQEVQVASQETENTQYVTGEVKQDIEEDTFSGFSL